MTELSQNLQICLRVIFTSPGSTTSADLDSSKHSSDTVAIVDKIYLIVIDMTCSRHRKRCSHLTCPCGLLPFPPPLLPFFIFGAVGAPINEVPGRERTLMM